LVVRAADQNKPWVAKLVKAYQSDEVKQYINSQFKGSVIAAW